MTNETISADAIARRAPDVIILNGASSSGKTTLAVALRDVLAGTWLVFGIDTLISAMPIGLVEMHEDAVIGDRPREHAVRPGGLVFRADGEVEAGSEFRRLESAWRKGLSTIAASGASLILDEVFMDGARSQDQLREAFAGRDVGWVGVTCDAETAKRRERDRGDRVVGQFERQATRVHDGVAYDLVVDTTSVDPNDVAHQVARHFGVATM